MTSNGNGMDIKEKVKVMEENRGGQTDILDIHRHTYIHRQT